MINNIHKNKAITIQNQIRLQYVNTHTDGIFLWFVLYVDISSICTTKEGFDVGKIPHGKIK